jgi:hypothetical protein
MEDEELVKLAVRSTFVLRYPTQTLETFGVTNIEYFILTKPVYDTDEEKHETVIRTGHVIASKPQIITPYYMAKAESFSEEAINYLKTQKQVLASLLYTYKNEPGELQIVDGTVSTVAARIAADLDNKNARLSAIITGEDTHWDLSLMKFIVDYTRDSIPNNVNELNKRHLIDIDHRGVPRSARIDIERMFEEVQGGSLDPDELKTELDNWDLFDEYEDRFYDLFR